MTEQELIRQLKNLKSIEPERQWVVLTRASLILLPRKNKSIFNVFSFVIPKPLAISVMAIVVAVLGGAHVYNVELADLEINRIIALTASLKHVADETAAEVAEIQELARVEASAKGSKGNTRGEGGKGNYGSDSGADGSSHAVVFNKDAEERESFQIFLKERIETKIAFFKDLFAQLDDGERVREITLNPRRYEENFQGVVSEQGEQILELLNEAEQALAEGDLITALDLVNAIEKLIKGS